jgi:transposase
MQQLLKHKDMKYKEVVGIDVSKLTIDAHHHQSNVHARFDNNSKGFRKLSTWMKKYSVGSVNELLVCFEVTGLYSLNLASFLSQKSIDYVMENAIQIKRSMGLTRGKADKVDAKRIAEYAYMRKDALKLTVLPTSEIIKLQNLLALRERMIKQKAGYQASLGEYKRVFIQKHEKDFFQMLNSLIVALKKQIQKAEKALLEIIESSSTLKKQYDLLTSITGIGIILASNILVTTVCFNKFDNSRKYACYCGTAPFEYSSGTSIRGRTKVSQMANKKMKALFNLAARSAIQHDPELKLYFRKRMDNGANGMSTINIIRNKIIHRVFAVIKRGTPYVTLTHNGI